MPLNLFSRTVIIYQVNTKKTCTSTDNKDHTVIFGTEHGKRSILKHYITLYANIQTITHRSISPEANGEKNIFFPKIVFIHQHSFLEE